MTLWIAVASAASPVVTPLLAPPDVLEQAKALGPKGDFACEALWSIPDAPWLCYLTSAGPKGGSRWVTQRDLAAWKVDLASLRSQAVAAAPQHLALRVQPIVDAQSKSYRVQDDAWAAAGFLAPEAVAAALGGLQFYATAPTSGAALFWAAGDAEADKMLAVASREMFDQLDNGVSPVLFEWNGKRWAAYAQATPAKPPPSEVALPK
jgi:hypothetical protein